MSVLLLDQAAVIVVLLVTAHVLLSRDGLAEFVTLMLVATPGIAFDSLLSSLGLYGFEGQRLVLALPLWLWLLWFAFAASINVSLRWLVRRKIVFVLVAPIAAILSYYSAMHLGAVSWPLGFSLVAMCLSVYWFLVACWIVTVVERQLGAVIVQRLQQKVARMRV